MSTPATIIIPCYNEQARLDVDAFCRYVQRDSNVRFLFVNDGSTDGTGALLERMAAENPVAFEAMTLPRNMGKAEAVRHGFMHAFENGAKYVGFWDADLATPLDDIAVFRDLLDTRPEIQIIFGARVNLLGRSVKRNLLRHWLGRIFATFAVAVIRVPIYDTQCGAKLFRATDLVKSIFKEPFISKWIFDVELVARLVQAQRASGGTVPSPRQIICEHPLNVWNDVAGSKLKHSDFLTVAIDLVRIYAKYIKR
jgi:dolichyl-phosphate beta-glucosyltransferase